LPERIEVHVEESTSDSGDPRPDHEVWINVGPTRGERDARTLIRAAKKIAYNCLRKEDTQENKIALDPE
jgi:hypothetical protein